LALINPSASFVRQTEILEILQNADHWTHPATAARGLIVLFLNGTDGTLKSFEKLSSSDLRVR
jgi:hypothetical protein